MRIFLVRHGDADAEVPEGLGDEARSLTTKGRQILQTHFTALRGHMGDYQRVLVSPLVRAVQTAQILSFAHDYDGPIRAHRSLLPDMPVGAIETVLDEHADEDVVLVGHQPSMGAITSYLLGIPNFPKSVNPGTVIGIERQPGEPAKFRFYAAPGQPLVDTIPGS